jgi:protein-S-isoprenylcysteine O-methyltransferase Ste14
MGDKTPKLILKPFLGYLSIFIITPTATYLLGRWLDNYLRLPIFPPYPINLITGAIVFAVGLYIGIKSTRLLYLYGSGLPWGGVRPDDRTIRLVTTGLYEYTRNPMILGYSMLPLGMGLMFQSITMTSLFPTIVLIFNILIVKTREEKRLEESFGKEYVTYREKTPFLIPDHRKSFQSLASWRNGYLSIILLPVLALALLYGLILNIPSNYFSWQRGISNALFIIICIIGIVVGIYPKIFSKNWPSEKPIENTKIAFQGHHPPCEAFSHHIIIIQGRTLCAGCIGLIIGGIAAILITFAPKSLLESNTVIIMILGGVFILIGLFQHVIDFGNPILHAILNTVLVVGVVLTRSGALLINDALTIDAYILVFTIYIIWTRIQLSNNDHVITCNACEKVCDNNQFVARP